MINSYSVARSHTGAGAGATATAGSAITLHFNYKSNNNNNNNNSGLKSMATATNEHKSQHYNNVTTSTTVAATTTAKMFKITQSEMESKHFLMAYPKQQQQQPVNWGVLPGIPSYVNTSACTKESSSNNNNNNNQKQQVQTTTKSTTAITKSAFIEVLTMPLQQQQQRTEDQENAFRQIEDVHNYAKLQHHHHLNHHQHHSQDMSSEEEEDDDNEEGEEEEIEEEEEEEELELDQLQIKKQQQHKLANVPHNITNIINKHKLINVEDSEEQLEVDVVTVTPTSAPTTPLQLQQQQQQHYQEQELLNSPTEQDLRPEHHARRPMNAFLIFCKRHRAIVKERYKSLENRAITKILGDWWAALDDQEKLCFTDLAQQNKDAFFNANPNFKWYKLPAPPLRTLATRPSNAIAVAATNDEQQQQQQQQLLQQQQQQQHQQLQWEPNDVAHVLRRNYFKFADETQMGELSVLLSGNGGNVQDKAAFALQQALSETTQFLSVHMPSNNNNNNNNSTVNNNNKRGLLVDSASNSSEEEERGSPGKKLKSSRSCKGKIYQELINSGQLAAIAKKSKCRLNSDSNTPPISPTSAATAATDCQQQQQQLLELETGTTRPTTTTTPTPTTVAHNRRNINNFDAATTTEFDLEEKIKELPALSLDAYLQRKRSTKKKKKFSSSKKQRNSNSSSSSSAAATVVTMATTGEQQQQQKLNKQTRNNKCTTAELTTTATTSAAVAAATAATVAAAAIVGSQKRKARKESITRRDVSAIEQEVASILPLTINGCYYFNQSQLQPATATRMQPATVATTNNIAATYDVTSTSDLLILAEVAANRTESN